MSLVDKILKEAKKRPTAKDPFMDKFLEELSKRHNIYINPLTGRELVVDEIGQIEVMKFDGCLYISSIMSFDSGKGAGSKLLNAITDAADVLHYTCKLGAKPFGRGGLNKKALIEFYLRHGFEIVPGQYGIKTIKGILKYVLSKNGADEDCEMIRKPK